jgi:hypothetical protein
LIFVISSRFVYLGGSFVQRFYHFGWRFGLDSSGLSPAMNAAQPQPSDDCSHQLLFGSIPATLARR